jgi:hypothetical protein
MRLRLVYMTAQQAQLLHLWYVMGLIVVASSYTNVVFVAMCFGYTWHKPYWHHLDRYENSNRYRSKYLQRDGITHYAYSHWHNGGHQHRHSGWHICKHCEYISLELVADDCGQVYWGAANGRVIKTLKTNRALSTNMQSYTVKTLSIGQVRYCSTTFKPN